MFKDDYVCMVSYDGMNINDSDETVPPDAELEKALSAML